MVWIETPTNPLLKVVDISAPSTRLAASAGARTVVDNTFADPYLQRPLELGADLVSIATKYLGGHSDVIGGLDRHPRRRARRAAAIPPERRGRGAQPVRLLAADARDADPGAAHGARLGRARP